MIRIAFFDIDGTLIDNETGRWSEKTIKGIQALQRHGVKVVLCSARPFHSMDKFGVFSLGIDWDGWISSAGAVANYQGQYLRKTLMKKEDIEGFCKMCGEDGYTMELVEVLTRKLVFGQTKDSQNYYRAFKESIPDDGVYEGEEVVGINFFAPEGVCYRYQKAFPGLVIHRYFESAVDVMGTLHRKEDGIKAVLKHLGLSKKEAIGFGDDVQDISMANGVGTFVCMGQGNEHVKEIADYVTSSIKEDGVYQALLHYNLIEEIG